MGSRSARALNPLREVYAPTSASGIASLFDRERLVTGNKM
jgi:hypothetical protein